jgi:nitroimidazol reductase NimA-like FMN-containing flavoprotein (pyridoxamine 5'-phosphate oxidase superfamily)
MSRTPPTLTELSVDECWGLLAAHRPTLGRIAFDDDGGRRVIHPMNYAVTERIVYLRTDPDSGLTGAVDSQTVAFEVDDVDPDWERGWSVLIQGRLHEVDDPDELARRRDLRLRTWAPGERLYLLRLDAEHVSGRRLE